MVGFLSRLSKIVSSAWGFCVVKLPEFRLGYSAIWWFLGLRHCCCRLPWSQSAEGFVSVREFLGSACAVVSRASWWYESEGYIFLFLLIQSLSQVIVGIHWVTRRHLWISKGRCEIVITVSVLPGPTNYELMSALAANEAGENMERYAGKLFLNWKPGFGMCCVRLAFKSWSFK